MVNILLYTSSFYPVTNGPAKFAQALHHLVDRQANVSLKILTDTKVLEPAAGVFEAASASWVSKLKLPLGKLKFSIHHHRNIQQFLEQQAAWRPDYVIFNDGCSGVYSCLRGIGRAKIVLMVNDDDYASSHQSGWWKSRESRVFYYHYYLEKLATRWAFSVFTASKYLKQLIEREYGLPSEKVIAFYQGIQLSLIEAEIPTEDNFPVAISQEKPLRLVFVKSDPVRGGLFELIAALGLLRQYAFELSIIGPFEDPTRQLKEALPPQLKMNYLGVLSQPATFEVMRQQHIYCTPSRRESLGIANMEALAVGTTVVSTRVGGIPEVLDDGNNGYLASACSPEAIAEAIAAAIADTPGNRQAKRQAGKAYALQHFNQTALVETFFSILRDRL